MVDISFPMKGWNTNCPRNEQPDGTSVDLLNVLPFDRDYRNRGSIRPGTGKFVAFALGGGDPVTLLRSVTVAVDPNSTQAADLLFREEFAYTNGTLSSRSGSPWVTGNVISTFSGTDPSNLLVSGNKIVFDGNPGNSGVTAHYSPVIVLGSSYILAATLKVSDLTKDWNFDIGFRSASAALTSGIYLHAGRHSSGPNVDLQFELFNTGASVSTIATLTGIVTNNTNFVLEVHVNGDNLSAVVDGVTYLTCNSSSFNSNTLTGFMMQVAATTNTMTLTNYSIYSSQPLSAYRKTDLIAVSGGNIYQGDTTLLPLANGGTGVLSVTVKPQMASAAGFCYFVDGTHNLKVLDLNSQTVTDIATSSGLETPVTLGAYSLACTWRDRLVLAASVAFPMNFIMSRQGDPSDWDYSALDAAAAVAGNASRAGSIGEPLNCLIPWTDDVLILGGDHSIYKVEGDIAAGGQILVVSEAIGTLGPDSWALDPIGNLYFVGTDGLYRMAQGGAPQNLSDSIRDFFVNVNRTTTYVVLTWDRDRNGLWIHMTPVNSGTATHVFWNAGTGAFFPIQYPNNTGPISAIVFDGDGPLDRQLVLGGRDGYVRKINPSLLNDDNGTVNANISSHVLIGPYRPAGDAALSVLEALEVVLGDAPTGFSESDFSMGLTVLAAKDAFTAVTSPQTSVSFSFTKQARRKRLLQRVSGGSFYFDLTGVSGKLWSFEKLVALFTQGGLQRRY